MSLIRLTLEAKDARIAKQARRIARLVMQRNAAVHRLTRVAEFQESLTRARTQVPGDNAWSIGYKEGAKDEREIIARDLLRILTEDES